MPAVMEGGREGGRERKKEEEKKEKMEKGERIINPSVTVSPWQLTLVSSLFPDDGHSQTFLVSRHQTLQVLQQ